MTNGLLVRLLSGLLLSFTGCATTYVPGAFNVPLLQARGDVHVAGRAGMPGVQVSGAYGVTDSFALRAEAQHAPFSGRSDVGALSYDHQVSFTSVGVGAGYYRAPSPLPGDDSFARGGRFSANLDLAGAAVHSAAIFSDGTQTVHAGKLLRTTAQVDGAYEMEYFAVGGGGRLSHLGFWHDSRSDRAGMYDGSFVLEPMVFVRAGPRHVKAEVQVLFSVPVLFYEQDMPDSMLPFPLTMAFGIACDF
jgi:hypothetical protein